MILKIVSILSLFGIPSVFAMVSWCLKKVIQESKQIKILMKAQQAQMRSQLLKDYYTYTNRGFIYEAELQDWIDQYEAYHSLGANGIMDKRKETLLNLDTREEILK